MSNHKSVWETLSPIVVDEFTEEKNGFTYLNWSYGWALLKSHYPSARFTKFKPEYLADNTATVSCRVWIRDSAGDCIEDVTEIYPVTNYANKPIENPNAFDMNSAYQRCLVKCLAYMGLGMYVFHGAEVNPYAPVTFMVTDVNGEVIETDQLDTVAEILVTFIKGNSEDINKLRTYWASNKQALDHLNKYKPEQYKRVYDLFMATAAELKGENS